MLEDMAVFRPVDGLGGYRRELVPDVGFSELPKGDTVRSDLLCEVRKTSFITDAADNDRGMF